MRGIRQMTYQPADDAATPVEVMTFDRLRELNRGSTQRADFHVLAVVHSGEGSVSVEFTNYALGRGAAVWIPPGAVHSWDDLADLRGDLVLFVPTAPAEPGTRALIAVPNAVPVWPVVPAAWTRVMAAVRHLRLESSAASEEDSNERVCGLLLSTLLLRLGPTPAALDPDGTLFGLFRAAVEDQFRSRHDAAFYARTLGCAPRTLSRAVQTATGRTAKAYLTERIVLEAKRLLVPERFTAARCAAELGFLDASSFSVFFRAVTGARPGEWRAAHLDGPARPAAGEPGAPGVRADRRRTGSPTERPCRGRTRVTE